MIFADDDMPPAPADAAPPAALLARDLLLACRDEARRLAHALADLDCQLGRAAGPLPLSLQGLDLMRQEAEGLARILALVAATAPRSRIEPGTIAAATPLQAQFRRLTDGPVSEIGAGAAAGAGMPADAGEFRGLGENAGQGGDTG